MRGPLVTGGVTLAAALVLFGSSAWGGAFVADPTVMRDTYHVSAILDTWGGYVADGHVPLWLPEFAGGAPAYATWIYGMLSPATLLFAMLPASAAWTWSAILHMVLGAVGLHAYLNARGLRDESAAAGALLFAFSEFAISRATGGHLNLFWPVAWTPWVLLGIQATVRGWKGGVPGLAIVSALALLSGHVQMWFFLGPLCALVAIATARTEGEPGALRRVVSAAALAIVLTAPQWIPTAEYAVLASRAEIDRSFLEQWCAAPWVLAEKVVPGALGVRPGTRWAEGSFENESAMIGGLAVFGLAALGFRRRDPLMRVWLAAIVVAVVFSIGKLSPATEWLTEIPPFSWARVPGRALVVPALVLPILAAHGVEAAAFHSDEREFRSRAKTAGVVVAVLALGTIAGLRMWSGGLAWPREVGEGAWRQVDADDGVVRAILWSAGGFLAVTLAVLETRKRPQRALLVPAAALAAALCVAPRVDTVDDAFYRDAGAQTVPAELRGHRVMLGDQRVPYPEPGGVGTLRPLSHVGTKWAHTLLDEMPPQIAPWFAVVGVMTAPGLPPGPPVDLAQRVGFVPAPWGVPDRARVYDGANVHTTDRETFEALSTGADELWVDGLGGGDDSEHCRGRVRRARATILARRDPNRLEVDVVAPDPGWLFVSEAYYPGWFTDFPGGHVRRGNVNFRAVRVPSGRGSPPEATSVSMRFHPISFYFGLLISLLGLVRVALLCRRDRRGPA